MADSDIVLALLSRNLAKSAILSGQKRKKRKAEERSAWEGVKGETLVPKYHIMKSPIRQTTGL